MDRPRSADEGETRERYRRLELLKAVLDERDLPATLVRSAMEPWAIQVANQMVFCAGAQGDYVFVTRCGRILANADAKGANVVAEFFQGNERQE